MERRTGAVLVVEDDDDDFDLMKGVLDRAEFEAPVYRVRHGEEMMDYVAGRGKYADRHEWPVPDLILLDLNLPVKDGRQALREIKSDPELKRIPVVILTTSRNEEDVLQAYQGGANSYVRKAAHYASLEELVNVIWNYWFTVVQLPMEHAGGYRSASRPA